MMFVTAFILQWWPLVLFNFWVMFSPPPAEMLLLAVFVLNFGGVFNCIAYTIIKRKLQGGAKPTTNVAKGPVQVTSEKNQGKIYTLQSNPSVNSSGP